MSNSRLVPAIRPGMQVKTRSIFPYPLPKGLSAGEEVTVVFVDRDSAVVRDELDLEWNVPVVALDPGQYLWAEGGWVRETADLV
jgi:hypothetical protein